MNSAGHPTQKPRGRRRNMSRTLPKRKAAGVARGWEAAKGAPSGEMKCLGVDMPNAPERLTLKWLVLWDVNFTSIKEATGEVGLHWG